MKRSPNVYLGFYIFIDGLLWFLGRKLSVLAWVTLAKHVGQSRVSNLWVECQEWDGHFAMPGPKAPNTELCDVGISHTYPCTPKSAFLYQRGKTTHE